VVLFALERHNASNDFHYDPSFKHFPTSHNVHHYLVEWYKNEHKDRGLPFYRQGVKRQSPLFLRDLVPLLRYVVRYDLLERA
jgi:hypothetical protein